MLSIIAYVLLAILLLIALVLLLATRKPDTFRVERSMRIAAPPDKVFALIDDLHAMNTWNPYALRETSGKAEYSGAERGKGARFDFAGQKSGTGHIEIVDTVPPQRAELLLVMTKPFACDNRVELTIRPVDAASDVTWAMSGRQPLIGKLMSLFIDCDRMIGRDFDEGLANLKRIAEAA